MAGGSTFNKTCVSWVFRNDGATQCHRSTFCLNIQQLFYQKMALSFSYILILSRSVAGKKEATDEQLPITTVGVNHNENIRNILYISKKGRHKDRFKMLNGSSQSIWGDGWLQISRVTAEPVTFTTDAQTEPLIIIQLTRQIKWL